MKSHSLFVSTLIMGLCMSLTLVAEKKSITSSDLPVAIAPYSQAILSTTSSGDQTLYMSGVLPIIKSNELIDDPYTATTLVMNHIKALLKEVGMHWNNVIDVIILVRDINDFKVISESYGAYLKTENIEILPVRLCFQAGKLPLNAVVEIKATAIKNV